MLQQIKDFTKIRNVVLFFDDEFNLGVVTKYKNAKILSIVKSFFEMFKRGKMIIRNKTLPALMSVDESADAIDIVYIFIGKPMMKALTPKELVAVVLHELGHVYSTTSSIPGNILLFLKTVLLKPIQINSSVSDWIFSKIVFLYTMIVSVLIHGITFTQHIGEYQADNFALRYGYGDELVLALNKFYKIEKVNKKNIATSKIFIKKIIDAFLRIFTTSKDETSESPHPDTKTRIEKLESQIFGEYKKTYPNYKEVFDLIRADYKAQEEKTR